MHLHVIGADAKPAVKPLTSFASANSQKSQKPTAKVKPQMKCMTSPSQELPPNILQRSNSRGNSISRMNELDDISVTDPLPVSRNAKATSAGNLLNNQQQRSSSEEYDIQSENIFI